MVSLTAEMNANSWTEFIYESVLAIQHLRMIKNVEYQTNLTNQLLALSVY